MAKAAKSRKKAVPRENVIVASKVKEYIKAHGLQSSADVVPALSDKVHDLLEAAMERTRSNNRSTVRPHDL